MSKEAMKLVDALTEYVIPDGFKYLGQLQEALQKEHLHKLAAESLNEGLRLDDWPKIGCVNHDCDRCSRSQTQGEEHMNNAFEQLMREADKPTQVLQDGVAEYVDALMNGTHEITSVTIRPKRTWVGLTDEERILCRSYDPEEAVAKTEAKLRSKNEDRN